MKVTHISVIQYLARLCIISLFIILFMYHKPIHSAVYVS